MLLFKIKSRLISTLVKEKNFSLVLVTHSLGVIREMTDRIYVMYGGVIVESGKTNIVFANPLHPYTIALMECVPRLQGTGISQGIKGEMVDYCNPPKGCRFHPRCPKAMEICCEQKPEMRKSESGDHFFACHFYD